MKVDIGNNYFQIQSTHAGVCKCSKLGTFLFLHFINDLYNDIKSKIKLFDDDVKLLVRP